MITDPTFIGVHAAVLWLVTQLFVDSSRNVPVTDEFVAGAFIGITSIGIKTYFS